MICSIIKRRLQKIPLSPQYKHQFSQALQQVQSKYHSQTLNKSLIIKKICKKYLKVCNKLTTESNIQQSLVALEFVKLLQLDIYQGKSYELFPIKITSHLLFVKCFDLKIGMKRGTPEEEEIKRKKRTYVQRLKMFVLEIEESFFYQFLQKDYYSNLQLILFLILRNQLQTLLQNNSLYLTTTQSILIQLTFIKKYVTKLFQLLKSHILQLNEMLIYLENKVYQLLTVKVKLMVQLFHIETVILFVEQVGEKFSEKEWGVYRRFLLEGERERGRNQKEGKNKGQQKKGMLKNFPIQEKTNEQDPPIRTFKTLAKKLYTQQKSFTAQSGGNYQNLSYQSLKARFSSQQIDLIWQKYDAIFTKIPNNINQQQIFEQVYTIINSFKEGKWGGTGKEIGGKKGESQKEDQQQEGEEDQDGELDEVKSEQQVVVQRRKNRVSSVYKERKNSELNDFMSFVKESQKRQVYFSKFNQQAQQNNNTISGQKDDVYQYDGQLNQSIASRKPSNDSVNKKSFLGGQNQQNLNQAKQQQSQNKENAQSWIQSQQIAQKTGGKDLAKRSNFKMIKDMNNIFEFICDKNLENKQLQNVQENPNQPQEKVELKSLLKNGKGVINKFSEKLKSQGFKKLSEVKTPTIKLLENMQQSEFQMLRRIKSTDILRKNKTTSTCISKKWSKQKIQKTRSKTIYFPFIQKQPQIISKCQVSRILDLPKIVPSATSKLFLPNSSKNTTKAQLKIKLRSDSKKTTLDIMQLNRLLAKKDIIHMTDSNKQNGSRVDGYGAIIEDSQLREQTEPKTYVSMDNKEEEGQNSSQ